jgi:hypothetical protein
MADPIWLDANIVARVANGDLALEAELKDLRNNKGRLA